MQRPPDSQREVKHAKILSAGCIESIGSDIIGWACCRERDTKTGHIALVLDDVVVPIEPTIDRPDVVQAGLAPISQVGFFLSTREAIATWRARAERRAALPSSIALAIDRRIVDVCNLPDPFDVSGRLVGMRDDQLYGWIRHNGPQKLLIEVQIALDDVEFDRVVASYPAPEGEAETNSRWFRLLLPFSPSGFSTVKVTARLALTDVQLENSPLLVESSLDRTICQHSRHMITAERNPGVSIVVPIYNAPIELERCLASVSAHTTNAARLFLLDDGSTDSSIDSLLSRHAGVANIHVVRNQGNLGFSATVNKGMTLADTDDVVLLNSDTVVPPRWLENLRFAAYSHPAIGTVTPLSDNAGLFSVPEPGIQNALPTELTTEEAGRLVSQQACGLFPDVPTGNGFCMYIKRTCLDDVGNFDSEAFSHGYGVENDFSIRAMRAGWRNVVDDRTLVHHVRSASFGGEERERLSKLARRKLDRRYPEYPHLVSAFSENWHIAVARYRVRRAFAMAKAGHRPRSRLLTVIATETGGTPLTNIDLALALEKEFEFFLLRSNSEQISLSRLNNGKFNVVARKTLGIPMSLAKHFSTEYDNLVAEWLTTFAIEVVHIRHIAFHGLGLTEVCRQLGIPVIFSFHDFYTVCPTVKLLDENQTFCAGSCTPGPGPCSAELWRSSDVPSLKHNWVRVWHQQIGAMLEPVDAFVTTSETARWVILANFPKLSERRFAIIPHGRDFRRFGRAASVPRPGQKIRLLAPGNLSVAKGADIIAQLKKLDIENRLEIHTMGRFSRVLSDAGVINHGIYAREDFVQIAEQIQPHFGLVLSIWPETYSHTLTELWAAGIPVVAFEVGAIGERMRTYAGGCLVTERSAGAVYHAILDLAKEKAACHRVLAKVLDWQERAGRFDNTQAMGAAYESLYTDVLLERKAFKEKS